MSVKNFPTKPITCNELKKYTCAKDGYNYKMSYELAKKVLGTDPIKLANKLLKQVMIYYPYKFNSVRFDPHTSNNCVKIQFVTIENYKIVSNKYPSFLFTCNKGNIRKVEYEKDMCNYDLSCVVERFNHIDIFANILKKANIPMSGEVELSVNSFSDYKLKETITWEAESYQKLFDDYVTANDRLKYINGSYYEWANPNVFDAYRAFLDNYNGNYFLDNAVRRGCIID